RYLRRFADEEGRKFLRRFYSRHTGQDSDRALASLVQGRSMSPRRLAVIYRSVRPGAGLEEFQRFVTSALPGRSINLEVLREMYRGYSRERFSLNDRAYLAD